MLALLACNQASAAVARYIDASNEKRIRMEIRRRRGILMSLFVTFLFSPNAYRRDEKRAGRLALLQMDSK